MKLTGTEKQVKYAKDLLNDLIDNRRIGILEKRGLENISEKHITKYNKMISVRDAVTSVEANASRVIPLVQDYNSGSALSIIETIEEINK